MGPKTIISALILLFVLGNCTKDKEQIPNSVPETLSDEDDYRMSKCPPMPVPEIRVEVIKSKIPVLTRRDDKYTADAQIKYHSDIMDRCRKAVKYFRELKDKINQALPKFETIRRSIIDIRITNSGSHPFFQEYRRKSKKIINAINEEIKYLNRTINVKRELLRYINNNIQGYSIRTIKKLNKMAKRTMNEIKQKSAMFGGLEDIERKKIYMVAGEWVRISFLWIADLKEIIGNKYKIVERYESIGRFSQIIDEYLDAIEKILRTKNLNALLDGTQMTQNVQEVVAIYDDLDRISPSESDTALSEITELDFDYSSDSSVTQMSIETDYDGDNGKEVLEISSPARTSSPSTKSRTPSPNLPEAIEQQELETEVEDSACINLPELMYHMGEKAESHQAEEDTPLHRELSREGSQELEDFTDKKFETDEFSIIRRLNGDMEIKLYREIEDPDFSHIDDNEISRLFKNFVVTQEILDCNILSLSGKHSPVCDEEGLRHGKDIDASLFAMHVENEKLKMLINKEKMRKIELYIREIESKKSILLSFMSATPGIMRTLGQEYVQDLQEALNKKLHEILCFCRDINWFFEKCTVRFEKINLYFSKKNYNMVRTLMVIPVISLPFSKKPIYFEAIGATSRIKLLKLYEKIVDYQKKVSMIFLLFDASVLFKRAQLNTARKGDVCKFVKKVVESLSNRNSVSGLLDSFVDHYKTLERDAIILYAASNFFDRKMLKSIVENCTEDLINGMIEFLSNREAFKNAYKTGNKFEDEKPEHTGQTISSVEPNACKKIGGDNLETGSVDKRTTSPHNAQVTHIPTYTRQKVKTSPEPSDKVEPIRCKEKETSKEQNAMTRTLIRESRYPSGEHKTSRKSQGAIPKRPLFKQEPVDDKELDYLADSRMKR
ncbi:hypothetical protein BEWA_016930 [Theileria equi strain WA]|uniref:Signal peptide-containing protein n=1 Tax=Theileria equi strain WA TaxID=1537102 RepID=L1L9U1_THEEQ|nr:hypothetical protein BEWA_016930 [Theileria equi strain WA]EKX72014.1 hypothetical protein BEWA_016930 [Theileria equi strain WA]|eukprot:XP_004831466.1 hypothetical protein BEWA_016930 [Theileria equi strain WA]